MKEYTYQETLKVRDYECDLQGIVNNAVYQNYLEHVRHEYLKSVGIDFAEYAEKGVNFVVFRVELDYKLPLKSGDEFIVGLNFEKESRLKFAFYQDIYRVSDQKPVLQAKIIGTAINAKGRPEIPEEVEAIFEAQGTLSSAQ